MRSSSRGFLTRISLALGVFLVVSIVIRFVNPWWMIPLLVPVLLMGFHYYTKLSRYWQAALMGLTLAMLIVSVGRVIKTMGTNIVDPPEWDFTLYWLYGRVTALGMNPYNSDHLRQLALPMHLSKEFMAELYLFQTPPTLFIFAPLGWFDIRTAYLLWYLVQGAMIALDVILLWKIFQPDSGLTGLALTATLVLILRSTRSTVFLGQLNFMVLFLLLLFWRDRERNLGGIWLALGILVKPVLVFLSLYLVLRRKWHVAATMVGTFIVVSIITMLIFGPALFLGYFTANPIIEKMPNSMYTETINQSLLATVLRLTKYDLNNRSPYTQPLFLFLATFLAVITGWLVARLDTAHSDWAVGLTSVFALLIFPKTLEHYSVLLIATLLLVWMHRQKLAGGAWGAALFIMLEYALISYPQGDLVFVAIALNWVILAGVCIWVLMRKQNQIVPQLQ